MVNSEKFAQRLQQIMDYYDLSAAAFADSIDVGRSSISHILSGRNKPSLEFIMKITESFPEVEIYWLLNGKGSFPSTQRFQPAVEKKIETAPTPKTPAQAPVAVPETSEKSGTSAERQIRKIVIFYRDGGFEAFEN